MKKTMSKRGNAPDNPWKLAHMGMELAGAAFVMALLGWLFDSKFGTKPWGVLVGTLIGVTGGMYLFIKEALLANKYSVRGYRGGLTGRPSLMKGGEDEGQGKESTADPIRGEDKDGHQDDAQIDNESCEDEQ